MSDKSHLCTHHHFGLRGCTRLKGHIANGKPHFNMFAGKNSATWTDEEGMYINSQEDWSNLINNLEGSKDLYTLKDG